MYFQQMDEHSLDALRQASSRPWRWATSWTRYARAPEQMQAEGTMEELIERLIERMQAEELISVTSLMTRPRQSTTRDRPVKPKPMPALRSQTESGLSWL